MLHLFDDPDIVTERRDCVVGRPAQLTSHCACKSSVQMRPRNLSAHSLVVFLGFISKSKETTMMPFISAPSGGALAAVS